MDNKNLYIKTDNNKYINQKSIIWVKKMNDCLEVCIKSRSCNVLQPPYKICKSISPNSYDKLNELIE